MLFRKVTLLKKSFFFIFSNTILYNKIENENGEYVKETTTEQITAEDHQNLIPY